MAVRDRGATARFWLIEGRCACRHGRHDGFSQYHGGVLRDWAETEANIATLEACTLASLQADPAAVVTVVKVLHGVDATKLGGGGPVTALLREVQVVGFQFPYVTAFEDGEDSNAANSKLLGETLFPLVLWLFVEISVDS